MSLIKILMLTGKENKTFFSRDSIAHKCIYENVYRKSFFSKYFRKSSLVVKFVLAEWKKNLQSYDVIFCIDSNITPETLKWMSKHKGNARIILYFRNKFFESTHRWKLSVLKKMPIEIWSYNIHDCEKYGFRYNSQVLNKNLFEGISSNKNEYSVVFVGFNKGRKEIASKIAQIVKEHNFLKPYIYMIGAGREIWNECHDDNKFLPYSEYLKKVSKSMAVLDLVSSENKGLTFRPLEAMFLKKKLITNYTEIVKYDFYLKENVFIVGVDDWNSFSCFLQTPYKEIPKQIVQSYTTDLWIKRFIDGE